MLFRKPYSLQKQFLSGLALASLVLGVIFAIGFYIHMRTVLEDEVEAKATLTFTQVDAVQNYVRKVLRPKMFEMMPNTFVIEAMSSSYISRSVMDHFKGDEGYLYRRVSINSRNPHSEANTLERKFISYFREHPKELIWKGYKEIAGQRYYVMARPVTYTESCMRCHGDINDAPVEVVQQYGERGFDKDVNSIGGVDLVGINVMASLGQLQKTIIGYFAFFVVGAIVFFSTTNVLFKVLVVDNIKRISSVFRENLEETGGIELLDSIEEQDEIEELETGLLELNNHLFMARAQLKEYAENLRTMVDERTEELTHEALQRRSDVALFVTLLSLMQKSRSRGELLNLAMPEIGNRFQATTVTYICTFASNTSYSWPSGAESQTLPEDWLYIITESGIKFESNRIIISVESSAGNAEGLLILYWDDPQFVQLQDHGLMRALGRQLGAAAENLVALDNMMRQMQTLQTIVEGITDPLVLMDASCNVLTANKAACNLSAEFSAGRDTSGNILTMLSDYNAADGCSMKLALSRKVPFVDEVVVDDARTFAMGIYPVIQGGNLPDRVVVHVRETTREKRMLAQMQQHEKLATIGKLAAGLAHEINNPLGVILCYAELLKDDAAAEQQTQDIDIILRHTRHAQRVLRDLLDFARPKVSHTGTADTAQVVHSIAEVFSVQAAAKKVELTASVMAENVLAAMGEQELEQILSNLVINAIDAVEENKGQIHLSAVHENDSVQVCIEDNGEGISPENMNRIFDPFFTTKGPGSGTGLGLAIVYGMVTDLGGKVEATSSTDFGGAKFVITLPIATSCDLGEE
jgi:signal transduction histidine kinase/CheY-like chemotaxis protein